VNISIKMINIKTYINKYVAHILIINVKKMCYKLLIEVHIIIKLIKLKYKIVVKDL